MTDLSTNTELMNNRWIDNPGIYYNGSGGCVYGETLITCIGKNNTLINMKVSEVKPDMFLLTRNTSTNQLEISRVELMTVLTYNGNLVWYPNDIALTPWHPVRNTHDSGYVFPELDERKTKEQGYKRFGYWNPVTPEVFDFVLENRGDLILGDMKVDNMEKIEMITLGHNITHDPTAVHNYLGNDCVVEDLKQQSTALGGKNILKIVKIIRNTISHSAPNQIIKFVCK